MYFKDRLHRDLRQNIEKMATDSETIKFGRVRNLIYDLLNCEIDLVKGGGRYFKRIKNDLRIIEATQTIQ